MDRRQAGLVLTLQHLGQRMALGKFDERLALQKAIYLAQAAGVDLGYYFQWYLRGPYAPALTRDAFDVDRDLEANEAEAQRWKLDAKSAERLKGLAKLLRRADRPGGPHARQLEIWASIHYLVVRLQFSKDDAPTLVREAKRLGKDFTREEVATAIQELTAHGLLPA